MIAFAAAWWWITPHGFPVTHSRFFLHSTMPALVAASSIGALTALWSGRARIAAALLIAVPAVATGAALTAAAIYPSARTPAALAALPGIAGLGAVALSFRRRDAALALACGTALGLAGGALWARAWRAEAPSTSPAGAPDLDSDPALAPSASSLYLLPRDRVLNVDVALRFRSCSPDRFLTVLVWPPACPPIASDVVAATGSAGETRLVAVTRVEDDVYSHLNSFSTIDLSQLRDVPRISFSPAPESPIEIVEGRYPIGAPYRMAYLGEDGVFRVVEASSGEKGPYRELASGPLRRGEPLTLTLWDGELPLVDVTFADYSAQASTELSPTAGWGFTQNAIEMQRDGSRAAIFLTLASTSPGRGFDSVGHRAGTYRNRVTITPR